MALCFFFSLFFLGGGGSRCAWVLGVFFAPLCVCFFGGAGGESVGAWVCFFLSTCVVFFGGIWAFLVLVFFFFYKVRRYPSFVLFAWLFFFCVCVCVCAQDLCVLFDFLGDTPPNKNKAKQ